MVNQVSTARRTKKPLNELDVYNARQAGSRLSGNRRFRLIDLFSGAGGLTLGFSKSFGHGFKSVWANDNDARAVETYVANFGQHCKFGDILEILEDDSQTLPEADLVIGGPPCQGFSLLNKAREGDLRRQMWRPFLEVVKRCGAKVFLMENVPQLLGTTEHVEIVHEAEEQGFEVISAKLCAADYGVAQVRKRAFILGSRVGDPSDVFPPKRTHISPKLLQKEGRLALKTFNGDYTEDPSPWEGLQQVISDLPSPAGTEIRSVSPPLDLHFGRNPTQKSRMRYRAIPKEGMNRFDLQRIAPELTPACWIRKTSGGTDLFGRLWWERPAFTIRTEFFKPEKGRYLHPTEHRPITHREAARIQSFPDTFKFCGSKIDIARQIGNAVPPLLASRVADCIYALLVSAPK